MILLLTLSFLMPMPIQAQNDLPTDSPPHQLSLEEARRAAQERMQIQVDASYAPGWIGAILEEPIQLFDLSGTVSAYLFSVTQRGVPAGYLTVAAAAIPNPVLEFATEGPHPLSVGLVHAQERAQSADRQLLNERPLYLGLLSYAYELTPSSKGRHVVDLATGEIVEVDQAQANEPLIGTLTSSPVTATGITSLLAYKLIGGVPDWDQFQGSYGCYSGCAPTSGVNVLGYWDGHGYGDLISGGDWKAAVNEMRTHMETYCAGNSGSTSVGKISSGMVDYAQAHGYYFESVLWCAQCSTQPTYANYRAEIDANHPLVVDVIEHATYRNHSVAGVGYDTNGNYMIIHDNWPSTGEDVYLQYGSGYSSIWMHPTAPDTTPPTQASNVRPDGWSGPYTSDTTPRFQWNAAYDSGSDVAGYYVSVDDWTPDSNDWWTEDTAYTVPDALSDGEYHFAVTSKDNAGNVNPSNTNTEGDAPYYAFVVDTKAPDNPTAVEIGCAAQDGVWQSTCTNPDFTWSGADDHGGSGVQDYHVYWGTDADGAPNLWRTDPVYDPPVIDTDVGVATYYLRLAARDSLGHESEPETVFTLRYDAAPPEGGFHLDGEAEMAYDRRVDVAPFGDDVGSGLTKIQLSNDGEDWQTLDYAPTLVWELPLEDHTLHTVYLRLVDAAGNLSSIYEQSICLDMTPPSPHSDSYRLWSAGAVAGGAVRSSPGFRLSDTIGQLASSRPMTSAHYHLQSGFQAAWPASQADALYETFTCGSSSSTVYLPLVLRAAP